MTELPSKSSIATSVAYVALEVVRTTSTVPLVAAVTQSRYAQTTFAWRMQCTRIAQCACRTCFSRGHKCPYCSAVIPSIKTASATYRCLALGFNLFDVRYAVWHCTSMKTCGLRWIARLRKPQCQLSTGVHR